MRVKDLSKEELKILIREAVEEALFELLGDPDQGLKLRPEIEERLRRSLEHLERGEQGIPAEEAAKRLGLVW
ncbi:hypothetical protein H5T56_01150 [Candidatus Bipolaricaulota bacterium]|nr:hypothetical protein [Candidatus Bipolaricaulota bacterium]